MTPYHYLLRPVSNRGMPPFAFIDELIAWSRTAPDDIFTANDEPGDVMGRLCGVLGPWSGPLHRKAAMIELLRCLAGFESSWHWNEGVDKTNSRSQSHPESEEAGIFQVSYDSLGLERGHHTLRELFASQRIAGLRDFIDRMKGNHFFAFEYAARLLRINYRWDGPISRGEIDSSLSRDAVAEIMTLLA